MSCSRTVGRGDRNVWTPRRILIFLTASGAFLTAFVVYFVFFGVYDGLAPLPDRYLDGGTTPPPPPMGEPEYVRLIRMAFGNECEELDKKKRTQTYLQTKSMVLS